MSARAAASALLLCFLAIPALHHPAHGGPWLPARGEYSADLRGNLFTVDSYRNDDGDRAPLAARWEERSLGATVEMGWKKRLSLVLGAPFVSATAEAGGLSLTNTSLGDLLVGARYGLKQGSSALALELDWQTPLGYSRMHSLLADSVRGNRGLQQLALGLQYGTPLAKRGFLQLGAGYGYRFLSLTKKGKHATGTLVPNHRAPGVNEESPLPDTLVRGRDDAKEMWSYPIQLSADLGLWFGRGLMIGGRYAGTMSSSHGDLEPDRSEHLVGPFLLYRVDERLDLSAGSWSTAMGRNVIHRDQFYVAITFKQTHLNRLQGFLGGTKAP